MAPCSDFMDMLRRLISCRIIIIIIIIIIRKFGYVFLFAFYNNYGCLVSFPR